MKKGTEGEGNLGGATTPRGHILTIFPLNFSEFFFVTFSFSWPRGFLLPSPLPFPSPSCPFRMIIPVRCFTCGKVIGDKWELYLQLLHTNAYEERYISKTKKKKKKKIEKIWKKKVNWSWNFNIWRHLRSCWLIYRFLNPAASKIYWLFFWKFLVNISLKFLF